MTYSKLSILQTSIRSYFTSSITLHTVQFSISKSTLYFPKDVSSFIGPDKRLQLPELGKQFNSRPRWRCSAKIGLRDGALWRSVFAVHLANEFICFCLRWISCDCAGQLAKSYFILGRVLLWRGRYATQLKGACCGCGCDCGCWAKCEMQKTPRQIDKRCCAPSAWLTVD